MPDDTSIQGWSTVRFATTDEQSASTLAYAKRGKGATWRGESSIARRLRAIPQYCHVGVDHLAVECKRCQEKSCRGSAACSVALAGPCLSWIIPHPDEDIDGLLPAWASMKAISL
jgi:hypothetical protein